MYDDICLVSDLCPCLCTGNNEFHRPPNHIPQTTSHSPQTRNHKPSQSTHMHSSTYTLINWMYIQRTLNPQPCTCMWLQVLAARGGWSGVCVYVVVGLESFFWLDLIFWRCRGSERGQNSPPPFTNVNITVGGCQIQNCASHAPWEALKTTTTTTKKILRSMGCIISHLTTPLTKTSSCFFCWAFYRRGVTEIKILSVALHEKQNK